MPANLPVLTASLLAGVAHRGLTVTEFAVERDNWQRLYGGYVRRAGIVPLRSFPDRQTAEALAARHEAAARAAVNPFAPVSCGGREPWRNATKYAGRCRDPEHATHLTEDELTTALRDAGISPPTTGGTWAAWWEQSQPRWTPAQADAVWGLLTRMRIYRVVERPAVPRAWAVLEVVWNNDGTPDTAHTEGGELVGLHRSRRRADADAAARTCERLRQWDTFPDTPFDMNARPFPGREFYEPKPDLPPYSRWMMDEHLAQHVPHFEVWEVPCEPGVGAEATLVTRTGFTLPVGPYSGLNAEPLCPARLFADWPAADAWAAAREVEARREFAYPWYGLASETGHRWCDTADACTLADAEAVLDLLRLPHLAPRTPGDFPLLRQEFGAWWHEHGHRVTPEQCAWVWAELRGPLTRFYTAGAVRFTGED